MIDEIEVNNLALISHASFTPCAGLTVLTGETGAGKTALLSACKLLMGERAQASLIRDSASELSVSGRFYVPASSDNADDNAGEDSSDEAAISSQEQELVITRRVGSDGRSRASIDGLMASIGELNSRVAPLIDLCSQHEHQNLMKPANHLAYLDAWAKDMLQEAKVQYLQAFAAAQQAKKEYDQAQAAVNTQNAALDEARFIVRRISEVDPQQGEYEELLELLKRAENAELLMRSSTDAYSAISADDAALDTLNAAIYSLDKAARYDESLKAIANSLREALYITEDAARQLCDYRDSIEFDAEALEEMQNRVSSMQGLMRSYGPRMEDVLERFEQAQQMIALVDNSAEYIEKTKKAYETAEAILEEKASALDKLRLKAIPLFEKAVNAQMERLQMGSAKLECEYVRLERNAWSKQSPSSFEFLFKAGSALAARPLSRIASGGEISRVMLALKVVLGASDTAQTLVFDEIDTGVGGATARALAEVLKELAQTHQVIVVTHLPQVAACAQAHFLVQKTSDESPETHIVELCLEEREKEIARMLAGDVSELSLLHAQQLLSENA